MALFHQRVIEKHIKHVQDIPSHHAGALGKWAENLERGIYDSETQNDGEFIQRILIDILGYVGSSDGQKWTVAKNQPVGKGNVDVALGHFTADNISILAPLELKGAKTRDLDAIMAGRNKTPVQQAWEYAMDAKGAQWVLVSNYREIRLYAVGYGRKEYESFDLSSLRQPEHYARFILLLSAQNLLEGKTLSLLKESEQAEKDITDQLYADYKILRRRLIDTIGKDNPEKDALDVIRYTQTILDRILFVAFAEDKGLLPDKTLAKAYETQNLFSPQPVWENFKGLFQAINKGNAALNIPGYNGGLFADDADLNNLTISNELCEGFKKLGEYDFGSDVSVNILGHIFEQSITDLEELKAQVEAGAEGAETEFDKKKSKRKKDGIFYTPAYITRYIVEQAVGGWLADRRKDIGFDKLPVLTDDDFASIKITGKRKLKHERNKNIAAHIAAWESYKEVLSHIKVLDPACGSGAFLNEVFDYLKKEGQTINNELARLTGEQTDLFRWDTHILANNIYGVDLNRESVEITKLSLWLKTANRNEKLTYLENNIKVGNSLIDDPAIAGDLAFDWHKEFPEIMDDGGFDVVVGNPPYIDSEEMAKSQKDARDYISGKYASAKGNWDIYIAFFELSFNVLKLGGSYLSFITPDKWISKDFGDQFRILHAEKIQEILVFGRDVFEEANVDSIVSIFKKSGANFIQTKLYDGRTTVNINSCKITDALTSPYKLDRLFSSHFALINKIENAASQTFISQLECENACATSDAYDLKNILIDGSGRNIESTHYKVVNTGTLSKFTPKWGFKPMRYLKDDYLFPIVSKTQFHAQFGQSYVSRAKSPKIIIKGLTLLDGALDLNGEYIPGKSTLVIKSNDLIKLKSFAALLNSRLAIFYIKEKYASSSYNGGISFTKHMINDFPLADNLDLTALASICDSMLAAKCSLQKVIYDFTALAAHTFSIPVTNFKGWDEWHQLNFGDFINLLEKQISSQKPTLPQKSEWMQHFETEKAKALVLKAEIDRLDVEIDQIVYALYGLTPDEIAIVEGES